MNFSNIFKHKDKTTPTDAPSPTQEGDKKDHHHHHTKQEDTSDVPRTFTNDAMRTSNRPDTLYAFDDPTARRLGPVPTTDPTNTGA